MEIEINGKKYPIISNENIDRKPKRKRHNWREILDQIPKGCNVTLPLSDDDVNTLRQYLYQHKEYEFTVTKVGENKILLINEA